MKIFTILSIFTFIATISCTEDVSEEPIFLFESTCTVDEEKLMEEMLVQDLSERLSDQAYTTLGTMDQYKDEYAQMMQNQVDFNALLKSLEGKEWLRSFKWYQNEILPKEKKLGTPMPPAYFEIFHNQSQTILPKMHKALKMILGGLVELKDHGFDTFNAETVQYIKKYTDDSIDLVKSVLCTFTTFMQASDVGEILPLTKDEVPKITEEINGLLYRDTLNFLEYLSQVFQFVTEDTEKLLCGVKASIGLPCAPDSYGPEYNVDKGK